MNWKSYSLGDENYEQRTKKDQGHLRDAFESPQVHIWPVDAEEKAAANANYAAIQISIINIVPGFPGHTDDYQHDCLWCKVEKDSWEKDIGCQR